MKSSKPLENYPVINSSDIVSSTTVTLWRNAANEKFEEMDKVELFTKCKLPKDLATAYRKLRKSEENLADKFPIAWDSDFGYLSPIPEHCGTAMQLECEMHLEALFLIGDLPPVINGIEAMRFAAGHIVQDGITQTAHLYRIHNRATLGISEEDLLAKAQRIFNHLMMQEANARRTLVEEMPRILEDALARSIAILQNARLLAPGELLDILSPVRLGVTLGFVDGITRDEIWSMMMEQLNAPELPPAKSAADDRKRDARDAKLADRINKRFAKVKLSRLANEYLK